MTLFEAVEAGDLGAARDRLQAGDDANANGEGQQTPLIVAARLGHAELVELLLDAGAEPFLKDAEQETALLKAAANGHADVCVMLMPLAEEDERAMARAFLSSAGKSHGPPVEGPADTWASFKRKAAVYGARAAKFVGHDKPGDRIQRVERAERRAGLANPGPALEPKKK